MCGLWFRLFGKGILAHGLHAAVVHLAGKVGVAVKHHSESAALEHAEIPACRKKAAVGLPRLGVDLNRKVVVGNGLKQILHQFVVPRF